MFSKSTRYDVRYQILQIKPESNKKYLFRAALKLEKKR